VFLYGPAGSFPNNTYNATNYWVDVVGEVPTALTQSLFTPGDTPARVTVDDANPVELGVKFRCAVAGHATGIRYYKGPQNSGPAPRPPVDGVRHAAGDGNLHRRDRQRLAAGGPHATGAVDGRRDLHRLVPHQRLLFGDLQLLHHGAHQWISHWTGQRRQRRQRRLQLRPRRKLPSRQLQRHQLLGRRRRPDCTG
jgi:hypothetical protein